MMGDEFMVKDMNGQDARESMLHGMEPYQALSAADEQARQRSLAENPSAVQVWVNQLLLGHCADPCTNQYMLHVTLGCTPAPDTRVKCW